MATDDDIRDLQERMRTTESQATDSRVMLAELSERVSSVAESVSHVASSLSSLTKSIAVLGTRLEDRSTALEAKLDEKSQESSNGAKELKGELLKAIETVAGKLESNDKDLASVKTSLAVTNEKLTWVIRLGTATLAAALALVGRLLFSVLAGD